MCTFKLVIGKTVSTYGIFEATMLCVSTLVERYKNIAIATKLEQGGVRKIIWFPVLRTYQELRRAEARSLTMVENNGQRIDYSQQMRIP